MELCVFFHRFLDIDFVFQQNSQANLPTTLEMGKSAPDRCDCSELAWVSTATFQPTENRPTVWNPCLAPQGFEHSLHSPAFCKSWCLAKVEMFLKDIFLERVKIYIYCVYIKMIQNDGTSKCASKAMMNICTPLLPAWHCEEQVWPHASFLPKLPLMLQEPLIL